MPTPTYDLIASNVLGSSASSVTFSSIPATYRDLVLVITNQTTSTDEFPDLGAQFNSDSGSNYPHVQMSGSNAGAGSFSATNHYARVGFPEKNSSSGWSLGISHIMDYSATDKHKTILTRRNGDTAPNLLQSAAIATRWASTSAISSIYLFNVDNSNFKTGSSFYLYGIVS